MLMITIISKYPLVMVWTWLFGVVGGDDVGSSLVFFRYLHWRLVCCLFCFVFLCFTLGLYEGLVNIQEEWENCDINEAMVFVVWILC